MPVRQAAEGAAGLTTPTAEPGLGGSRRPVSVTRVLPGVGGALLRHRPRTVVFKALQVFNPSGRGSGVATRHHGGMTRTGGLLAGAVVATMVLAGCGSRSTVLDDVAPTTTERGPTTQPALQIDREQAFDDVQDVVQRARALLDRLYEDPSLLDDPDARELEPLQEVFAPNSPALREHRETLEDLADEGNSYEPSRRVPSTLVLVFGLDLAGPDRVSFQYCTALDVEVVDDDGDRADDPLSQMETGVGEAVLRSGNWVIGTMEAREVHLRNPGSVHPDECGLYFGRLHREDVIELPDEPVDDADPDDEDDD
jgi:hypothetical protein